MLTLENCLSQFHCPEEGCSPFHKKSQGMEKGKRNTQIKIRDQTRNQKSQASIRMRLIYDTDVRIIKTGNLKDH